MYERLTFQVLDLINNSPIGSCFQIRPSIFLTVAHIIPVSIENVGIRHMFFKEGEYIPTKVKTIDRNIDLAILSIEGSLDTTYDWFPTITNTEPELGTRVCWLGYPILPGETDVRHYRIGVGFVCSRKFADRNGVEVYEINGEMNSGHSGSPIFNPDTGELVGIVQASSGSMKELTRYLLEFKECLKLAIEPLLLDIENPMRPLMIGNVPPGWLKLIPQQGDVFEIVNKYNTLLHYLGIKYDLKHLILDNNSFAFSPSISILISLGSLFQGFSNLVLAIQQSYQLGVGRTITPSVIRHFLEKSKIY